jgi:hypothetical protein
MLSFVETRAFSALARRYLGEDGLMALQAYLMLHPFAGTVIRGAGGVRKVRWGRAGGGKRGGFRVIYYYKVKSGVIWLLTMYAKNEVEVLPSHVLKEIREQVDEEET